MRRYYPTKEAQIRWKLPKKRVYEGAYIPFCLVAFKGQNQRVVCQRERVKGGCKVREVKREGWREMGGVKR